MAIDNVVPIDAQTARIIEQRKSNFRWFVAAVTGVWLAVLVPVLAFTPLPPLAPFVVLALLVILAEHQFVLFGDETSMSASIIVVVASIFVFADTAPLAGPMLIASLGGLYLPHLRQLAIGKVAFNGTGMGLSAVAAAVPVAVLFSSNDPLTRRLVELSLGVLIYWAINNALVAGYQFVSYGKDFRSSARCLLTSDLDVLRWAFVACIGVLVCGGNPELAVPIIAAVVAVRATLQSSRRWHRGRSTFCSSTLIGVAVWLTALAALASTGHVAASEVAFALTLVCLSASALGSNGGVAGLALMVGCALSLDSSFVLPVVLVVAGIAILLRGVTPSLRWYACVTIACASWLLFADYGIAPADSLLACALAVAVPTSIAVALFYAPAMRRLAPWSRLLALGLLAPSKRDLLLLVGIILIARASTSYPELAVLAAAVVAACFCSRVFSRPRRTAAGASH